MYGVFFFAFIGCTVILVRYLQFIGILPQWGTSAAIFVFAICTYVFAVFRFRLFRAVRDTATSKISSLPYGFTEVCGTAKKYPNFYGIYQSLRVKEKPNRYMFTGFLKNMGLRLFNLEPDTTSTVENGLSGTSMDQFRCFPFYIDDGTGLVYVDPLKAKIIVDVKRWGDEDYTYEEAIINDGDAVYCLGTSGRVTKDINAEINEALKAARASKDFVSKYDVNGDGIISQLEWEAARKKITDEVLEKNTSESTKVFTNTIGKGSDNKIFIISNKSEKDLTSLLLRQSVEMFAGSIIIAAVAVFDAFVRLNLLPAEVSAAYHSYLQFIILAFAVAILIYSSREQFKL